MRNKQMGAGQLVLALAMLVNHTMISAATYVTVRDSSTPSAVCVEGPVKTELRITEDALGVKQVVLDVDAVCTPTTPRGLANIENLSAIEQGNQLSINLADHMDIIAEVPLFSLTTTDPKDIDGMIVGSITSINESALQIVYLAPVAGDDSIDVGETNNVSSDYMITDNSAPPDNSKSAQVTIPVKWKDPGTTQPPTGTCEESSTVECMGSLTEWPSGTLRRVSLAAGKTHVYDFHYVVEDNGEGQFVLFDGEPKTVSISLDANDFSHESGDPCQITQKRSLDPLAYNFEEIADWYHCGLKNVTTYYLNIKSTSSEQDYYSLTVY